MPKRRIPPKKSTKSANSTNPQKAKASHGVSQYEYAQLCAQLARVEALAARNRTDLDIQLRRIAELQHELDMLKTSAAAPPRADSLFDPPKAQRR